MPSSKLGQQVEVIGRRPLPFVQGPQVRLDASPATVPALGQWDLQQSAR